MINYKGNLGSGQVLGPLEVPRRALGHLFDLSLIRIRSNDYRSFQVSLNWTIKFTKKLHFLDNFCIDLSFQNDLDSKIGWVCVSRKDGFYSFKYIFPSRLPEVIFRINLKPWIPKPPKLDFYLKVLNTTIFKTTNTLIFN